MFDTSKNEKSMNKNQKNIIAVILPLATFLIALKLASFFSSDYEEDRNPFLFDKTWWIWLTWVIGCGYFELKLFSNEGLVLPNIRDKLHNISTDNIIKKGLDLLLTGGILIVFSIIPYYSMPQIDYLVAYIYTIICYIFAHYLGKNREIGTKWTFLIALFITPIISLFVVLTNPKFDSTKSETKIVYIIRLIVSLFIMAGGILNAYHGWQNFQLEDYNRAYLHNQGQEPLSRFLMGIGLFITGYYLIGARRYFKNTLSK